jgi:hypothetical protein
MGNTLTSAAGTCLLAAVNPTTSVQGRAAEQELSVFLPSSLTPSALARVAAMDQLLLDSWGSLLSEVACIVVADGCPDQLESLPQNRSVAPSCEAARCPSCSGAGGVPLASSSITWRGNTSDRRAS